MNILEAIEEMKKGKIIHRDGWYHFLVITPLGVQTFRYWIDFKKVASKAVEASYSYEDVTSNEWEIYEIPNN